jgi:hypothetical protein
MGFTVMSVLSVCEFAMIFVIKWFVDRDRKRAAVVQCGIGRRASDEDSHPSLMKNQVQQTRGGEDDCNKEVI